LLAALIVLVVALAMGGPASAAKPCWREVVDEWTTKQRVSTTHPITCYDQALDNLPRDLADYTDAYDQIANARQDALQDDRRPQGPVAGAGDDDPGGSGPLVGVGNGDSSSIPLPLIILAALAGLLMAAGGAGLVARKLQARRAGPPTAPE
jgi:hypothetical protein